MRHESCIHYGKATLGAAHYLDEAKERRTLPMRAPVSAELLRRIQEGALASPLPDEPFKDAVRQTLRRAQS